MEIVRPHWSSASFLVYAGGATVLGSAGGALGYLSSQYGDGAFAAWALLVFVVLLAVAAGLRATHRVAAGVFAFVAVLAFAAFLAALWTWFGWRPGAGSSPFRGFHVSRLALLLLVLLAAVAAIRSFRAPVLAAIVTFVSWWLVTDVVSNGGDWTAWVTLVLGVLLLLVGTSLDGGDRRPYGFWVHVVAGSTVGGALIFFWHSGNWHWAFIAAGGVVFVRVAVATGRSSWTVLGALGLLAAATHFAVEWWHRGIPLLETGPVSNAPRGWVPPLVFAVTGFLLTLLGLAVSRRERG